MTDAADPFAQLAHEQIVAPIKARMRAAKTREERRVANQLTAKQILSEQWKAWHRKQLAKLRLSHYGKAVDEVASFLETMTLQDGGELIALVERGPWRQADDDTRFRILNLIDSRIVHLRIIEGLAPFDDPLDDEPTVFLILREILQ